MTSELWFLSIDFHLLYFYSPRYYDDCIIEPTNVGLIFSSKECPGLTLSFISSNILHHYCFLVECRTRGISFHVHGENAWWWLQPNHDSQETPLDDSHSLFLPIPLPEHKENVFFLYRIWKRYVPHVCESSHLTVSFFPLLMYFDFLISQWVVGGNLIPVYFSICP